MTIAKKIATNNSNVDTANTLPTGYIFTTYSTRTGFDSNGYTNDVEKTDITYAALGNAESFDGIYRELTFFNEDNKNGWEVKTVDGKILAKGNTKAEAIKARDIICNGGSIEADDNAEVETATDMTPEYKYYIKSRRPIFGAAPNGYIKAISGEVREPVRRLNGTYSPKCKIYFATVIYDKPLTDEQILNYDLAVSNATFELINTATVDDKTVTANTIAETDGSEDDDDDNEVFNLMPNVDELNDVEEDDPWLMDDPAEYTDRNDRYNRGEKIAADLTAKLRPFDPTVEVTFRIDYEYDEEDGKDIFYLQFDGIHGAYCNATNVESIFHDLKRDIAEVAKDATIDPPVVTPADDFTAKLAELKAKQTAAKIALDEKDTAMLKAQEEYEKADKAWRKINYAIDRLLNKKGDELMAKLNALTITNLKIKTSDGKEFNAGESFGSIHTLYGNFTITTQCQNRHYWCGYYDTPAQVETVIEWIKAAVECGDTEFEFPTVEELATPEPDKTATDAKVIFDRVVKVRRHGIKHITTKQGRHMWYIYGRLVNKKEITEWLADEDFTVDEYIAAEKIADKYKDEVDFPRFLAIHKQADYLKDKIRRDRKPSNEPLPALFPAEDGDDDELIDPPEIDKTATADSLTRAMTIALENYQDFCRVKNLTAATNELSLYNICRKAMTELWKGEAA